MSKVPKLRFPEFEGEWEEKELENILEYERPDNYIVSDTNYSKVGIPVLTANKSFILGYTEENEGVFKDIPVIIFDDFTTDKKYVDFPFKVKSSAIKILKTKKDSLKFIYEAMSLIDFEATEHKRYYISAYQKIPLHIPSIAEQQKIADCLSSLDELIEARKEKIASLKAYKKGLLQQLFPQDMCNNYPPHPLIFSKLPKLRFTGFEEEWEEVKLGEIGVFLSSLTGKIKEDFEQGNAKYIPYKNVYKNTFVDIRSLEKVNVREEEKQNAVKKGDILFTISSETPEEAGMSSVLVDEIKDCYVNSFCSLFRFNSLSDKNIYFYGYLLRHHTIREYFRKTAQGSTRFNLSKESFKNLSLVVPKLGEQQKIADCLLSLDEKIAAETEQVAQLQQHKKGLLQQLLV